LNRKGCNFVFYFGRVPHTLGASPVNKPNFFIVGAAKSGTTTLYDYLKDHPEVFMPQDDLHKEPSHFSNLITWYNKPEK
jgi:hypothetical protein